MFNPEHVMPPSFQIDSKVSSYLEDRPAIVGQFQQYDQELTEYIVIFTTLSQGQCDGGYYVKKCSRPCPWNVGARHPVL